MFKDLTSRKLLLGALVCSGSLAFSATGYAQDTNSDVTPPPAAELEAPVAEPDLFYDAQSLVPDSQLGAASGPRKLNPSVEPASKYVVVRKNHSAGSHQAKMVSAERAMTLGRYDSALTLYDELYTNNKRDPNILLGRAAALQKLGRNEEAIQTYDALLDLRPDNLEAQVNMLGLMGDRYPAVALQKLSDLKEKNPDNVSIIAQMAVAEAGLGRYDEAVRYLGVAASIEPQNALHLFNMAVIADRAGSRDEAIKYYERALEVDTVYGGGRTIPREAVFERLALLR
ncbi:MAG: tetratricopeptide repeat protein [Alphaproteobacteria bacterium]|nr:tetratricopeptide repeat protein [Alphaproteobacteria bacterium]